jgi:2-iminobutanoate/2-iminopropanoate deaminase
MRQEAIVPTGMGRVGLPYSPGVRVGPILAVSGMVGKDSAEGARRLVGSDVTAQMRQAVDNLRSVLQAAGLGLDAVFKVTVFLTDPAHFDEMNRVYVESFSEPFPARSTVIVRLVRDEFLVEIEALAWDDRAGR